MGPEVAGGSGACKPLRTSTAECRRSRESEASWTARESGAHLTAGSRQAVRCSRRATPSPRTAPAAGPPQSTPAGSRCAASFRISGGWGSRWSSGRSRAGGRGTRRRGRGGLRGRRPWVAGRCRLDGLGLEGGSNGHNWPGCRWGDDAARSNAPTARPSRTNLMAACTAALPRCPGPARWVRRTRGRRIWTRARG